MNLDLINGIFNNFKENKLVQNYLENNIENNSKVKNTGYEFNDLLSEDLILYDTKITARYRDKILIERANILQDYAKNAGKPEDMYYIYNNASERNSYNLCCCDQNRSNKVITKKIGELPSGSKIGSILTKQGDRFILDIDATRDVGERINTMIKEKIDEQNQYLDSKRVEGHTYKVGEKYSERIWLYDVDNVDGGGIKGIEEIEFPQDLYENAKEGDLFVYNNGKYYKK